MVCKIYSGKLLVFKENSSFPVASMKHSPGYKLIFVSHTVHDIIFII